MLGPENEVSLTFVKKIEETFFVEILSLLKDRFFCLNLESSSE